MNFLIIIAAVLMVHQGSSLQYIQKDKWFQIIFGRFSQPAASPWLPLVLLVLAPIILLVLLLSAVSDSRSLIFIVSGVVLLYAIGRGSWRQECAQWVELFAEKDPTVLREKLMLIESTDETQSSDEEIEGIWQRARARVLYSQLSGFYAVVFWFFLLGAPAAFLYRLLSLYQQERSALENPTIVDAEKFIWLLEWLPVRLMGLFFCVVGQFSTAFWVLRQMMSDGVTSSVDVLSRCADAALFVDRDNLDEEDELSFSEQERNKKRMERVTAKSLEKKTLVIMRGYCGQLQRLLGYVEVAFLAALAVIVLL